MTTTFRSRGRIKAIIVGVAVIGGVLALAFAAVVGFRLVTGRTVGFGLWRVKHLGLAVLDSTSVAGTARGEYTNVIFLHHSTGGNLIEQGDVRQRFSEAGYDFWDHGYNTQGLRRPDGSFAGYSYRIPRDNTDPDGLAAIFAQRAYPLPLNALSGLLQHEVIVFKSCFPASNITSDEQLQQVKEWYLGMRDVMDKHPDRVFVVMSPPPLNPAATTPEAAGRARAFADWLRADAYLAGHPNIFAFDFFDQLAEGDPAAADYNMLRADYREGDDSHPNQVANEAVGPLFAEAVMRAARSYRERQGLMPVTSREAVVGSPSGNATYGDVRQGKRGTRAQTARWLHVAGRGAPGLLAFIGGPRRAKPDPQARARRALVGRLALFVLALGLLGDACDGEWYPRLFVEGGAFPTADSGLYSMFAAYKCFIAGERLSSGT